MSGLNFQYLLYIVYDFFVTLFRMIFDQSLRTEILGWFDIIWWICLFASIPLLAGVIYFLYKYETILREQRARVYGKPKNIIEGVKEEFSVSPSVKNETWEKIVTLIGSDNPNDWKLAILEADKVLEMVVNTFAVPGDNMGDKMKNIERGDFEHLEEAWQAHKVRNRIAHEQNFHISQREARVAVDNYEKVFREFDFI
ncbi:MAG TPA: hypothetical protein P5274_01075 [Candidatus Paceibacterota bacterium]|nr:hypothetical protein [Candidatus Paceibacterota bacterium]